MAVYRGEGCRWASPGLMQTIRTNKVCFEVDVVVEAIKGQGKFDSVDFKLVISRALTYCSFYFDRADTIPDDLHRIYCS